MGLRPPVLCPRQPVLLWAPGAGPLRCWRKSSFVPVSTTAPRCWFWGGCWTPSVAETSWRREAGGLWCPRGAGELGKVAEGGWQWPAGPSGDFQVAAAGHSPCVASVALLPRGWKQPGAVPVPAGSPLPPVHATLASWGTSKSPRGHGSLVPGGLGLHGWWQRAQRVPGPLPCPLRVPSQLRVASRGGAAAGREGWQELGPGRGVRGEPAPPLPPWAGTAPRPRGGLGQSRLLKNGAVVS